MAKAQQASKQAARKVQQQGGALKDVLTEDTGSTLGAAGILGLAVVVAGALVLGGSAPPPVAASTSCSSHHAVAIWLCP